MNCGKCEKPIAGACVEERFYLFGRILLFVMEKNERDGMACGRRGCFRWLCPECAGDALCASHEKELQELQ